MSLSDRKSFSAMFRLWYVPLLCHACRYVCREDAENVVQDVMLDLWARRSTLVVSGSIGSYLFTAVRNRCLNVIEHNVVHERYLSSERLALLDKCTVENPGSVSETVSLLRSALSNLPEEQREAFLLNRVEGLTFREIAVRTGVHEKTVEYRISKALKAVAKALGQEEG